MSEVMKVGVMNVGQSAARYSQFSFAFLKFSFVVFSCQQNSSGFSSFAIILLLEVKVTDGDGKPLEGLTIGFHYVANPNHTPICL